MNLQRVEQLQDPRLAPYRDVRDRTLRGESLFLAEGDLVVERLLDSPFPVTSVLVVDRALERVRPMLEAKVGPGVPIYVVPFEGRPDVVGFPFHQGVMAAGERRVFWTLEKLTESSAAAKRRVIVVLPDITKPDNVGVVFRSAAAFGAEGVLLGERACDPLSRRGLRVSMGGVLQLPWRKSSDIVADLERLRSEFGYTVWGTVLDPDAADVRQTQWPDRVALCFGNEYDGLDAETLAHCDVRVTLPMRAGVDSLNLGVSAGIFLYAALRA